MNDISGCERARVVINKYLKRMLDTTITQGDMLRVSNECARGIEAWAADRKGPLENSPETFRIAGEARTSLVRD